MWGEGREASKENQEREEMVAGGRLGVWVLGPGSEKGDTEGGGDLAHLQPLLC